MAKTIPKTASAKKKPSGAKAESTPAFRVTSPDRVVFTEPRFTKGDLANYYQTVARWMLPHLAGRPLSLVRCPEGTSGKCFYQKHPPVGMSSAVRRVSIVEKDGPAQYLVVEDEEGLMTLIQFGAMEIHVWGSRSDRVEQPDRLVFDLDPDPAVAWQRVVEAAFMMRELLQALGLESFLKTSGGKGLHVIAPIDRRHEWPEVKEFARSLVSQIAVAMPNQFVANMSKAVRRGKIYIDFLRNDRGSTTVAPYSTRARQGGKVSTPIAWEELPGLSGPRAFDVLNVPARLKKLRKDPWQGIEKLRQSLSGAMKKARELNAALAAPARARK